MDFILTCKTSTTTKSYTRETLLAAFDGNVGMMNEYLLSMFPDYTPVDAYRERRSLVDVEAEQVLLETPTMRYYFASQRNFDNAMSIVVVH